MPDRKKKVGSCLCGEVSFVVESMSSTFSACHCKACQKWTGGPLLSVECGDAIDFQGQENISVYDSSSWAERGFCRNCGSPLFYRFKKNQQHFIPLGLFENVDDLIFEHQIFIEKKPSCYSFANKTKLMTEKECLEAFQDYL